MKTRRVTKGIAMNARDGIESLSKEDLIDLVFKYSDNGYFPLEPFLLKVEYAFTSDDLTGVWESTYEKAMEYENQKSDFGGSVIEEWSYDCTPVMEGRRVDDISLLLSLECEKDERIQQGLDEIRRKHGLLVAEEEY